MPIACRASSLDVRAIRIAAARSGTTSCARYCRSASRSQVTRSGVGRRCVGLEERRVAEGHLEIVEAVADQRLERHRYRRSWSRSARAPRRRDRGLIVRQAQQDVAEAGVGVAAVQLEMDLAEPEPAAELGAAGPALDGRRDRSRSRRTSCAPVPGRGRFPSRRRDRRQLAAVGGRGSAAEEARRRIEPRRPTPVDSGRQSQEQPRQEAREQATHG